MHVPGDMLLMLLLWVPGGQNMDAGCRLGAAVRLCAVRLCAVRLCAVRLCAGRLVLLGVSFALAFVE